MEWISVEDRLPKAYDQVLIYAERCCGDKYHQLGAIDSAGDWAFAGVSSLIYNVTHWKALDKPKGGITNGRTH